MLNIGMITEQKPPYRYHLINRLKGIDQSILQTQAQTQRKYPTI
jgi:hypothetical protein